MARFALVSVAVIGLYLLAVFGFVEVANADLYGRLIETKTAAGVGKPAAPDAPKVRLVLHRVLEDENRVESSLVIEAHNDRSEAVKAGRLELVAEVRGCGAEEPYGVAFSAALNRQTAQARAGQNAIAVQSARFTLRAFPSISGFPFDDLSLRPCVTLFENGTYTTDFKLEIERSLPGRLMRLSNASIVDVYLTRSVTEKALVVTTSGVFLFLSATLAAVLFSSSIGLRTIDELLGIGGYLVAAAGFREVLGISRVAGTSALEVGVIGLPVLVLSIGVAVSIMRGRKRGGAGK